MNCQSNSAIPFAEKRLAGALAVQSFFQLATLSDPFYPFSLLLFGLSDALPHYILKCHVRSTNLVLVKYEAFNHYYYIPKLYQSLSSTSVIIQVL